MSLNAHQPHSSSGGISLHQDKLTRRRLVSEGQPHSCSQSWFPWPIYGKVRRDREAGNYGCCFFKKLNGSLEVAVLWGGEKGNFGNFNDGDTLGFMEVLFGILPLLRVTQGAALLVDNEGLHNSTAQANQLPKT